MLSVLVVPLEPVVVDQQASSDGGGVDGSGVPRQSTALAARSRRSSGSVSVISLSKTFRLSSVYWFTGEGVFEHTGQKKTKQIREEVTCAVMSDYCVEND